jgi:hypothetical protein
MASPIHVAISPGGAPSAAGGGMVPRARFQAFEANQKPALAPMERPGLGFSPRGTACTSSLVAPVFKEQLK